MELPMWLAGLLVIAVVLVAAWLPAWLRARHRIDPHDVVDIRVIAALTRTQDIWTELADVDSDEARLTLQHWLEGHGGER